MMAKGPGSTRVSHWGSINDYEGDLYAVNGVRMLYKDLPDDRKELIKKITKQLQKEMWEKFKDRTTPQTVDGKPIIISYVHNDLDDAVRDMMIVLSGMYFSKESILNIDKSLEKAEYVPTDHSDTEERSDGRKLWFRFKDNEGRGVYYSVTRITDGRYAFHSVTDRLPTKKG